jgi:hypothetical protein
VRGTLQKRTTKRSRLLLTGHLDGTDGPQEVRIRDVSSDGALVEAATAPAIQDQVRLMCGDTVLAGRVVWVDGAWCGIEFSEPISGTLVDYTGNKLKVSAPRTYRHDRLQVEDRKENIRTVLRLRDRLN